MFDIIIIWAVKTLASYAVSWTIKKLGQTDGAAHIMQELENAKALNPDPLPSPAAQRKPKQYTDN